MTDIKIEEYPDEHSGKGITQMTNIKIEELPRWTNIAINELPR
jgi:hypothetical protein